MHAALRIFGRRQLQTQALRMRQEIEMRSRACVMYIGKLCMLSGSRDVYDKAIRRVGIARGETEEMARELWSLMSLWSRTAW